MTEPHDNVLLEDEYLEAAHELREVTAQIKELTERQAQLKLVLEKVLTVGERGVAADGTPLVAIKGGAGKFSPEQAVKNLPAELIEAIQVTTLDGAKAKAILAPALYELCLKYNKNSVVAL